MVKLNTTESSRKKKIKVPFFFAKREHKVLKSEILKSISKSFLHGQTLQGPEVKILEKKMAKLVGKKYAVAVGSCTDALFFSLKALGIGKGDEVIVTSYSYLASATCILRCGAKPVFVDVDESGNMKIKQIINKINKKTKAIIYVHLYGYFQNINKLKKILKSKKISLIEDFAQSLGAFKKKIKAGSIGDISCTSFDPTKVISAPGSGGMAFSDDVLIKDKIIKLRYHGKSKDGDHDFLGMNSQLPSIVAASLLIKIKKLNINQKKRIAIAKKYIEGLKNLNLKLPPFYKDGQHIYHKFVIKLEKRDELSEFLKKNGVECLVHYKKSLPELTIFKKYMSKFPIANELKKKSLSIPIHPYLTSEEIKYVISTIKTFFNKND